VSVKVDDTSLAAGGSRYLQQLTKHYSVAAREPVIVYIDRGLRLTVIGTEKACLRLAYRFQTGRVSQFGARWTYTREPARLAE
jgi:hypothetical protein